MGRRVVAVDFIPNRAHFRKLARVMATCERELQTPVGVVKVCPATPDKIVDLRHAVLRAGLPRTSAVFAGDEHADARHVLARSATGRVVGCATVHVSTWDDAPAWQLRGMATDPAFRAAGVGRAMLACLEGLLAGSPVRHLWCNARVPAVGFYEKLGWRVVSDEFQIPTAGPHVKMTKTLTIR